MHELLDLETQNMALYWGVYGVLSGVMMAIAIYLLFSKRAAFVSNERTLSPMIRKSAGLIIGVSSILYLAVFFILFLLQTLVLRMQFGLMTDWGVSLSQQMKVLFFLPSISIFACSILQGMTKVQPVHILLSMIFPAMLLVWTIVFCLFNLGNDISQFNHNILTVARFYWSVYVILMIYYYVKALHRYKKKIRELYSDISNREVQWLGYLGVFNVIYFAWFVWVYGFGMPLGWGVMAQHVMALLLSIYVCYHADRQELITWEKEEETELAFAADDPMLTELDQKLNQLIEQQFFLNPDLTRDELSNLLQTNRTYLTRYFVAKNTTFYTLVNKCRIDYAITLMQDLSNPRRLNEVALASGFKSLEVFSRQFKHITGCLPS